MMEALTELACFHQCHIEGYAHARPDALAMFYAHIHAWKVIGFEAPDGDAIRSSEDAEGFDGGHSRLHGIKRSEHLS